MHRQWTIACPRLNRHLTPEVHAHLTLTSSSANQLQSMISPCTVSGPLRVHDRTNPSWPWRSKHVWQIVTLRLAGRTERSSRIPCALSTLSSSIPKLKRTSLGRQVGSVVRALDLRSKGRVFESRQEHKNNFEFFRVKSLCWLAVGVPNPPCVYARTRKTVYAR